jgi:hypothetical protein
MNNLISKLKKKAKFILDSSKEIYKEKGNKKYYTIVGDNKDNLILMIEYMKVFIKLQKEKYLGLDFEFNSKKIALFQINFESELPDNFIFVFYPPDLSNDQKKILINLLTDQISLKILHGGESLDLPYLFDELIINHKNIRLFTNNLVDTRYLCEAFYIKNDINYQCKIYSLLEKMEVISEKKLDELKENGKKMGPIYEIFIDVNNLSDSLLKYSLYDTLFLPSLIKKFPKKDLYSKLIPEFTTVNFLAKRQVDNNIISINETISKLNNNFIYVDSLNNKNIKLIDFYILLWDRIFDDKKYIIVLKKINYFKKFLQVIFKFLVYKRVLTLHSVFQKKAVKTNIKLNNQIDFIKDYQTISNFFNQIEEKINESFNKLKHSVVYKSTTN